MSQPNEHEAGPRPADLAAKATPSGAPMHSESLSERHSMAVAVRPEMHLARRANQVLGAKPDSHAESADPHLKTDREAIETWTNEGDPN